MNYTDMIKNAPNKSEELMWRTIEQVNALINDLQKSHPDKAKAFLLSLYSTLYGNHFNEPFARDSVASMFHTAKDGHTVTGEAITPERAFPALIPSGNKELYWDAYVGANAFLHDLARTNLSEAQILDCAREFWFSDDDFPEGGKILWYSINK